MLEQESDNEFKSTLVTVAELTNKIDNLLVSVEVAKEELKAQYKVLRKAHSRFEEHSKKTISTAVVVLDTGEAFVIDQLDTNIDPGGRVRVTPTNIIKQEKYTVLNL